MLEDKEDITKIIEKVKKLLSLSSDKCNEHEASTAAVMAAKLMESYNLSMADVIVEDLGKSKINIVDEPMHFWAYKKSFPTWFQVLASNISQTFDCHAKMKAYFDEERCEAMARIQIYGYKPDVEVAKYVFSFLIGQIEKLANIAWDEVDPTQKRHIKQYSGAYAWKRDYKYGIVLNILGKIKELYKKKEILSSVGTSLMVIKEEAINEKYGTFSYGTADNTVEHYSAYVQGVKDAEKIELRKAVHSEVQEKVFIK